MPLLLEDPLVDRALTIATLAYDDQDGAGTLALSRLIRVASRLNDPADQVVILLHDVISTTAMTSTQLYDDGIPAELVLDVVALTRTRHEPRTDFMARIRSNGNRACRVAQALFDDQVNPTVLAALPSNERAQLEAAKTYNLAGFTCRAAA